MQDINRKVVRVIFIIDQKELLVILLIGNLISYNRFLVELEDCLEEERRSHRDQAMDLLDRGRATMAQDREETHSDLQATITDRKEEILSDLQVTTNGPKVPLVDLIDLKDLHGPTHSPNLDQAMPSKCYLPQILQLGDLQLKLR